VAYATGETVFCRYCPSGSLFAAFPNIFLLNLNPIPVGVWIHVITFATVLIGVLIIGRVWCRYFCPLGAIFGAFNRISGLTMNVDSTLCIGCRNCLKHCPMGIDDVKAIGSSTDCIRCGKCVEVCPAKAIRFALDV
jgi:polyferredoxin